jgi:hypothetical protein
MFFWCFGALRGDGDDGVFWRFGGHGVFIARRLGEFEVVALGTRGRIVHCVCVVMHGRV